jgi:acetyl esterase/lipase
MGGSAGGHLALLTAYTANDPDLQPADLDVDTSVRAAVSFYGPPDLRALYDYICTGSGGVEIGRGRFAGPLIKTSQSLLRRRGWLPASGRFIEPMDVLPNLLGGAPNEVPQLYRLGTVTNHVGPDCPPTLLLQGAHDFGGMLPDVRRLHRALLEAGVTSIYVEFPDTDHGFDLLWPRWSPAAQAATYDTERFLALMI